MTSVSMRVSTRKKLTATVNRLNNRGIMVSEQRMMRECLEVALKFWRGKKGIAQRCKTYNKRRGPYQIVSWYVTENVRSAAWARCHHSGIALSRLMDFAIDTYLPRIEAQSLQTNYFWQNRNDVRKEPGLIARHRNLDFFIISYRARTESNNGTILAFFEQTEILPWPPPRPNVA